MKEKELAISAELATQIRKSIIEKARLADAELPVEEALITNKRQRRGLKHSTPSANADGLLEKEIKERERSRNPVGSKYKPRPKWELTSKDITDICHSYIVDKLSQEEVAKKYRVTAALVGWLVNETKKHPEKARERKQKEKMREKAKDAVEQIAGEMLAQSVPITKTSIIQEKAMGKHGIDINKQ